jgi:hypothetical protein
MSTEDDHSRLPNDEELRKQAGDVWGRVKLFYAILGVVAVIVLAVGGTAVYQSFGARGIIVGFVALAVGLWLLGRWLLTF